MKRPALLCVMLTALFLVDAAWSQVTNFTINGSTTSFTMTSGGLIDWSYNIPAGEGALGEIWIDVNANHAIDPATDRRVISFVQTDGDTLGNNGPPDTDGLVNGEVHLTMPVGLAPADYIVRFEHNSVGQSIWGTMHPLASPAFSVSGTVHAPPSVDVSYLVVEAERDMTGGVSFWMALTDANGDYTIEMGPDTAGNPWTVFLDNIPPGTTIGRNDTLVVIDGHLTGVDFTVHAPAAQVMGQLLTEAGDTLRYATVYVARMSSGSGGNVVHDGQTDGAGRFWFGIPADELNGDPWQLSEWFDNQPVAGRIMATTMLPALTDGDSVVRNLVSYPVNSTIQGFVQIDGSVPGFPLRLMAFNRDSGSSFVDVGGSGMFTMPVSDRIYNYEFWPMDLMGPYQYPYVVAHPGDAGVIYNITMTGVDEPDDGMPAAYSLGQNYPNPFNPLTTIPYALPERSAVRLAVYDLLGREVATLVDEVQEPGVKSVLFDVASLPSGVYAYRIVAKGFTATKLMMVVR